MDDSPSDNDTNVKDIISLQWSSQTSNFYGSMLNTVLSPGALYARKQSLTSPLSVNPPNYPNLSCSVQDLGMSGGVQPYVQSSQTYGAAGGYTYYRFNTASQGAGEAVWDAPRTAGYLTGAVVYDSNNIQRTETSFVSAASKPLYDNYDGFKENLKHIARGYSVVPEFRISERI